MRELGDSTEGRFEDQLKKYRAEEAEEGAGLPEGECLPEDSEATDGSIEEAPRRGRSGRGGAKNVERDADNGIDKGIERSTDELREKRGRGGCFTAAIALGLIAALALLSAGYVYMVLPSKLPFGDDGVFTLMVVGTDVDYVAPNTRAEVSIGRADVVMVLLMPRGSQTATIISIPRDTLVTNGGGREVRFNSLYKGLPPDALMEGVSKVTGLGVDRWIKVDFDAFVGFVDALGGVTVTVDKRMYYEDDAAKYIIDLQPGKQSLNGKQALGFVRYRQDALGDIARVARQQQLFKSIAKAAINPAHIFKVGEFLDIVDKYVVNDMNLYEYAAIGMRALKVGPGNFDTLTLPGHFSGPYWEADEAEIDKLIESIKGGGDR